MIEKRNEKRQVSSPERKLNISNIKGDENLHLGRMPETSVNLVVSKDSGSRSDKLAESGNYSVLSKLHKNKSLFEEEQYLNN